MIVESLKEKLEERVKKFEQQLLKIRTNRANPHILDSIKVDYYGTETPLKQLAHISQPEGRILQLQPFDKTLLPVLEKTLLAANLGATPTHDGNILRLPFPSLTEETRKIIVKELKQYVEETKIALRNYRRESLEEVKKLEKDKEIREDDVKVFQDKIQKILDDMNHKIDELAQKKEKDILQV